MPQWIGLLLPRLWSILYPIIAQVGWSLMNERLIRGVAGKTLLWIQETWYPESEYPRLAPMMVEVAEHVLPPKISELKK